MLIKILSLTLAALIFFIPIILLTRWFFKWRKSLSRIFYYRRNVRVKFDNPDKMYPYAHLEYKIKFKWVKVNEASFTDHNWVALSPEELVNKLVKNGQRFKSVKIKNRKFDNNLAKLKTAATCAP